MGCTFEERCKTSLRGACDFALTPLAILDLIAIAPTILGFITPELYLLRIVRLVRIGRVGRSKRFRQSIKYFNRAIAAKKKHYSSPLCIQVLSLLSAVS